MDEITNNEFEEQFNDVYDSNSFVNNSNNDYNSLHYEDDEELKKEIEEELYYGVYFDCEFAEDTNNNTYSVRDATDDDLKKFTSITDDGDDGDQESDDDNDENKKSFDNVSKSSSANDSNLFSIKDYNIVSTSTPINKVDRKSSKQSLREIIEDAGMTIEELKSFLDKGSNKKLSKSINISTDSSDSEYYVISETSNKFDSDDEDNGDFLRLSSDSDEVLEVNWVDVDASNNNNNNNNSINKRNHDIYLQNILMRIPDNCSWKISSLDVSGQSKSRGSRYYNPLSHARCRNCNEKGHLAHNCPKPRKQYRCILCGREGHLFRSCPDQTCFRCHKPGHALKECTRGYTSWCSRCHARGHFEESCSDTWRQFHITTQEGEIVRKCKRNNNNNNKKKKNTNNTNNNDGGDGNDNNASDGNDHRLTPSCYNCGSGSHLGHVCKDNRMDKFQFVSSLFIHKYDKMLGPVGITTSSSLSSFKDIHLKKTSKTVNMLSSSQGVISNRIKNKNFHQGCDNNINNYDEDGVDYNDEPVAGCSHDYKRSHDDGMNLTSTPKYGVGGNFKRPPSTFHGTKSMFPNKRESLAPFKEPLHIKWSALHKSNSNSNFTNKSTNKSTNRDEPIVIDYDDDIDVAGNTESKSTTSKKHMPKSRSFPVMPRDSDFERSTDALTKSNKPYPNPQMSLDGTNLTDRQLQDAYYGEKEMRIARRKEKKRLKREKKKEERLNESLPTTSNQFISWKTPPLKNQSTNNSKPSPKKTPAHSKNNFKKRHSHKYEDNNNNHNNNNSNSNYNIRNDVDYRQNNNHNNTISGSRSSYIDTHNPNYDNGKNNNHNHSRNFRHQYNNNNSVLSWGNTNNSTPNSRRNKTNLSQHRHIRLNQSNNINNDYNDGNDNYNNNNHNGSNYISPRGFRLSYNRQ